jgi:predicted DNA-binding protein (MmcQ/YjbR family)
VGFKTRAEGMNALTIAPDRLGRLREICLSHRGAVEKIAWGDPTWRIEDRIFAMQKGNFAGGRPSVWFKGELGAQAALVDSDTSRFFVPPYVASKGWIGVYVDTTDVDWDELDHLIGVSFELIRK